MANIAFFKIGKSIKFNKKSWNGFGGDIEAPTLITRFAELNPNDTIYLIGANDVHKIYADLDFPQNIKSLWPKNRKQSIEERINELKSGMEKNKIDYAFFYCGVTSARAQLREYVKVNDGSRLYTPLQCFENYAAPTIHALNQLSYEIPMIGLNVDLRYKNNAADWEWKNRPRLYLAQNNAEYDEYCWSNPPELDKETKKVKFIYSGIETVFLMRQKKPNNNYKNREGFNIVLNQGVSTGALDRFIPVKEYILDNNIDCNIYGKWKKEIIEEYEQFNGPVFIENLKKMLLKTKYTFIVPVTKDFTTSKFWEMIHYGIIPFMHPWYDGEFNILPENHFLRCKNPEELIEKINYLENNNDKYIELFNELQEMLKDEYYDGTFVNNKIWKYLKKVKQLSK